MKIITLRQIDEIKQRLLNTFDPEQVYLFGSHAWGEPHDHSDIDLLVVVSSNDMTPHKRAVKGQWALRGMGFAVDILVPTRAEFDLFRDVCGSLTYKIVHDGKLIHDRSQTAVG